VVVHAFDAAVAEAPGADLPLLAVPVEPARDHGNAHLVHAAMGSATVLVPHARRTVARAVASGTARRARRTVFVRHAREALEGADALPAVAHLVARTVQVLEAIPGRLALPIEADLASRAISILVAPGRGRRGRRRPDAGRLGSALGHAPTAFAPLPGRAPGVGAAFPTLADIDASSAPDGEPRKPQKAQELRSPRHRPKRSAFGRACPTPRRHAKPTSPQFSETNAG
jgi:hypothetical protein